MKMNVCLSLRQHITKPDGYIRNHITETCIIEIVVNDYECSIYIVFVFSASINWHAICNIHHLQWQNYQMLCKLMQKSIKDWATMHTHFWKICKFYNIQHLFKKKDEITYGNIMYKFLIMSNSKCSSLATFLMR